MKPSADAGQPSALAINPRNREASTARRIKLLKAFDGLPEDTRADLLEITEQIAFNQGEVRAERATARGIIRQVYTAAGWEQR